MIFDTHWFTTGYHLVDGGERYQGTYISDEMPWYLHGVPYDYRGAPELAVAMETVSRERRGYVRAIRHPDLGRHYATINVIKQLKLDLMDIPVVSVSSCQNCDWQHFVQSGADIGEAIRRSDQRVMLLASGALSHKFNNIDWKPNNPRIFHESNVSRPENIAERQGRDRADARGPARPDPGALGRGVPAQAVGGVWRALPADARRHGWYRLPRPWRSVIRL